jgi:hypothetical protein
VRIPVAVLEHKHVSENTLDDVLEIVKWSLECAFEGTYPGQRHDGAPWTKSDAKRKRLKGNIGCRSALCRVAGDWKMFKELFRFPQHNETAGICFRCRATPNNFKDVGANAPWRAARMSHWDVITRLIHNGLKVSPLFGLPFFDINLVFRLDWMHIADLGVSADFTGQLLTYLLAKLPGRNREERLQALRTHIRNGYERHPTESKVGKITANRLSLSANAPKLRAHAAEVRGLIPICKDLASTLLGDEDNIEITAKRCMFELAACYENLTEGSNPSDLARHCRRFSWLYVSLEGHSEIWWARPKLHLFQELCELDNTKPANHWTYREEDFGGTLVGLARSRGGARQPGTVGRQVLLKFIARHKVPNVSARRQL